MKLYLIRHGQSTGNDRQCFLGWGDHPLTEAGRAQARAVAARLAPLGPMAVHCSDLARARETAEIVAGAWQGTMFPDARWREVGCGRYEGEPWEAFSRDLALAAEFDRDPYGTRMPGGESAAEMAARATAAYLELCASTDEQLAVVTHDGPIRAVLAHCLGIPPERFWSFATSHGGLTVIEIRDGWTTVRSMNETGHLG